MNTKRKSKQRKQLPSPARNKSHLKSSAIKSRGTGSGVSRRRKRLSRSIESYLAKFPQSDTKAQKVWLRRLLKDENVRDRIKQIREQLEEAHKADSEAVAAFFRRYSIVTPLNAAQAVLAASDRANLADIQRVLANYVEFALRFGVYARLNPARKPVENKNPPRAFSLYVLPRPVAKRMKARVGEHIRPDIEKAPVSLDSEEAPSGEEVTYSQFECPALYLPKKVAEELEKSGARILQLLDDSTASVLHELEYWFYDANSVTFVVHGDKPKVILCLVGENIRKKDWRHCERLVTAMQLEYLRRSQAGRRKKRVARAVAERQAKLPGRQKDKAGSLQLDIKDSSRYEAISRADKRLRERKNP